MRKINIILIMILVIISANQTLAQTGKYTAKLSELYDEEKYEEIIDYKKGKIKSFESKSLYYKAMAYYMTDEDKTALKYFDMAIDKGPADHDMYYYKAMALYYLNRYEESLPFYDIAISMLPEEPSFYGGKGITYYYMAEFDSSLLYLNKAAEFYNCSEIVYLYLGEIYYEIEDYDDGIKFYKKALALNEPQSDRHRSCSYNIALGQQFGKKYEEAKKSFESHLKIYTQDYPAVSKLIQMHYALNEIDETISLKEDLVDAYKSGDLPDHMSDMYCFDQFEWNNKDILAFECYEKYKTEVLIWKHKFFILDDGGEIDYKVQTVLDTNQESSINDSYLMCLIREDTIYTYDHFVYNDSSSYQEFKQAVIDILDDNVKPISKKGDFSAWLSSEQQKKMGSLGSSYENAVPINSVSAEYDWLRKYYPGYDFMQQSLMFNEGTAYDVLKFKTKEGEVKEIYFDISSFFGQY